jgi:hypothetical protein
LGLAFLGVVPYLVSELFELFPPQTAEATLFTPSALGQGLLVAACAGSALFLASLIRTLWQVNPVADRARVGHAGLLV